MAERALRGSRLGAQSYETDAGIEMAPRQSVTYDCARGHRLAMPFSLEADVPEVWECTVCGSEAAKALCQGHVVGIGIVRLDRLGFGR